MAIYNMKKKSKNHRSPAKPRPLAMPANNARQLLRPRRRTAESGPVFVRNLLDDVSRDDLIVALIQTGQQAATDLPQCKDELFRLFKQYDPFLILAKLASYALTVGLSDDGRSTPGENSQNPQQSHVELAQAIMLSLSSEEYGGDLIPASDFQLIWDGLVSLASHFAKARYAQLTTLNDVRSQREYIIVEHLRLHTQYVRNWGYFSYVVEILKALYSTITHIFEDEIGLSAAKIIDLFAWMLQRVEDDLNELFKRLVFCFGATTRRELVNRYYASFPNLTGNADEMFAFVSRQKISRQALIVLTLGHSDLQRIKFYTFTVDEIAERLGCDLRTTKGLMDRFSIPLGGLSEFKFDHIFLGNPIWYKPIVPIGNNSYFCALPQLFFTFSPASVEQIFYNSPEAQTIISRRRAEFLEGSIADLFRDKFPDAEIARNFSWEAGGRRYETDLVIKFDQQLFIIEAKSGKVTDVALRGAIGRVKTHLEDLILKPCIQAERLKGYLQGMRFEGSLPPDVVIQLPFDVEGVHRITTLSILLEDFAVVQANAREFKIGELLGQDLPNAVCMTLADLKVVFHILEPPAEVVHYIVRRCEVQRCVRYFGDEIDMLGYYISLGLIFGELEKSLDRIGISGMSRGIDEYFAAIEHKIDCKKPMRKMSKWFSDMSKFLAERRVSGWTELAYIIYCVGYDDQMKLEHQFQVIARRLKKQGGPREGQVDTVCYMPPPWSDMGIAIVALFDNEKRLRHGKMRNAASHVFSGSGADMCAVIALDIDCKEYPYATYGVFRR